MKRCPAILALWIAASAALEAAAPATRPITLCHVSFPYVTAQSDRLPENRKFIDRNPGILKAAIEAIHAAAPDVVTVAGNLTWFGSDEDYRAVQSALGGIVPPPHVFPGESDLAAGGAERFAKAFQTAAWTSFDRDGLHVILAGAVSKGREDEFAAWLEKDLAGAESAVTALVLSSWLPRENSKAVELALAHRVCAWIGGANNGPAVQWVRGLPVVTAPALGWTGRFSHMLVHVRADAITLELVPRDGQMTHRTDLPNPRAARATPTPEARVLERHRQICARRPRLTFVQISDTQFDDETDRVAGARYATATAQVKDAVAEINRLEPAPALVLVTGDLTNKGTPAEWELYAQIVLKGLKAPVRALPGNHDFDEPWSPKKSGTSFPPPGLTRFQGTTGDTPCDAWETSGVQFISLDTADFRIDPRQLAWLEEKLKAARGSPVIVVGHHPIDQKLGSSVGEGAAEAVKLLGDYGALAYLCGHRHFWACSRAGGFLNYVCNDLCWPNDNGYVIYHVFDDELLVCYKPLGQDAMWELSWPRASRSGAKPAGRGDAVP